MEAIVVGQGVGRAKPQAVENEFVALNQAFDIVIVVAVGVTGFTGPREKSITSSACWMCSWRGLPSRSTRFQSNSRYVVSLACWISAIKRPAPSACTVPASIRTQSPTRGSNSWRHDFAITASELALERLPIDAGFQAGVNLASWFGGQDDPGFGFSQDRAD